MTSLPHSTFPLAAHIKDVAIFFLSEQLMIQSWNPGLGKLFGYEESDIVGRPLGTLFQELLEAESPLETTSYDGERWAVRQNGELFWCNVASSRMDVDKDVGNNEPLHGWVVMIQDFSENLQNRERLVTSQKHLINIQHALNESTIVAITDPKGVITYVNDAFCRISKFAANELIGKTHSLVNSGFHSSDFFEEMWQTITKGHIWQGVIKNKAKDHSFYWVSTSIVPFYDDDGRIYQYIAIRHDVTQKKRIEEELRLLNMELEKRVDTRTHELALKNQELEHALIDLRQSEKQRDAFISALTHDMRTPLVAQKRALEILHESEDQLPERLKSLPNRLVKSNDDLLDLVNRLLDVYHLEAGKVNILPEWFDCAGLLETCIDGLSDLAEARQIGVHNQIEKGIEILADQQLMGRVFQNLLGNAIHNLRAGDQIEIRIAEQSEHWVFDVCDNGPGISEEILPHLFDRHFMMQRTRKKIGSGLGLSICKMILGLHGGDIIAKSSSQTGTCFTITLPKQISSQPNRGYRFYGQ